MCSGNATPTVRAAWLHTASRRDALAPVSSAYATAGIACSTKTVLVMNKLIKLRIRAFFAQRCRCIYCNLPIWEPAYKERFSEALGIPQILLPHLRSTAEHLFARQEGGTDSRFNIAAACHWCNWKRHAHRNDCAPDPQHFLQEVRRAMKAKLWHPAARWVDRA